jgi:phenylpropionate dioxygenase-like ring-hydroxylating dioxygenase large terminal subunit
LDIEAQGRLLDRLLDLRERRTTALADTVRRQPATSYTDPDRLRHEVRALFRGHPLVVGLSCDLRGCGDYRALDVAGVPVLLVRSEDGTVRAFLNSCRHRGSPIVEGSGTAERIFKCPYHAWCYDVEGRLMGQPMARGAFDEVPTEELGLIPLPVAEAGGLILLRPRAGAEVIDGPAHLGGLATELAGYGFEDFTLFGERTLELRASWKQPYETFLESYHVFALHQNTISREILSTPMLCDFYGPHGRAALLGRKTERLIAEDADRYTLRNTGNIVYWLFPNVVLSMPMTGHAELWQTYPDPDVPGRCTVTLRFYIPRTHAGDDRTPFWERMLDYSVRIVMEEDFPQQERIYRGLASGSHPGPVFGRNEPGLIHFHRSVEAALS